MVIVPINEWTPDEVFVSVGRTFRPLCADLEARLDARGLDIRVSLEDVGGSTRAAKVQNLIEFLNRRRFLDVLVEMVREQRPRR